MDLRRATHAASSEPLRPSGDRCPAVRFAHWIQICSKTLGRGLPKANPPAANDVWHHGGVSDVMPDIDRRCFGLL
jgi:hypothetical protein